MSKLKVTDMAGEFGIGSRHLHDSLKRLAVVEPNFVGSMNGQYSGQLSEIVDSEEKSHNFLITAAGDASFGPEVVRNTRVISI